MRDTFLIMLTDNEKNLLHLMIKDTEAVYRAKIILLKDDGYTLPQIRMITIFIMIITWEMDTP